MKSFLAVILLVSLAAIVSCQINQQRYSGGNRQKPGTCYRPGGGNRYRRSADGDEKKIEKRQFFIPARPAAIFGNQGGYGGSQGGNGIGGGSHGGNGIIGGGSHGGNGWGNTRRCYNDYDCQGNNKCCNGNCQTPSFVG